MQGIGWWSFSKDSSVGGERERLGRNLAETSSQDGTGLQFSPSHCHSSSFTYKYPISSVVSVKKYFKLWSVDRYFSLVPQETSPLEKMNSSSSFVLFFALTALPL